MGVPSRTLLRSRAMPSKRTPPSHVSPRRPDGRRARVGPHLGPIRITPTRVMLTVGLVGGLAFLAYATIVRDALQIPLMASGFAIVGLACAAIAVVGAANVIRAGREGREAAAFVNALGGGIAAVVALMSFAAALVFALLWRSNS